MGPSGTASERCRIGMGEIGERRGPPGLLKLLILCCEKPGGSLEDQMSLQGAADVSARAQASGTLGDLCTGLYWV